MLLDSNSFDKMVKLSFVSLLSAKLSPIERSDV